MMEVTEVHSRLLKAPLLVVESRAFWEHAVPDEPAPTADRAFEEGWFGRKSHATVKILLSTFALRYGGFPDALRALRAWTTITAEERALVCHWHVQLTDPLYRRFTGEFLVERVVPTVAHDQVVRWVEEQVPCRFQPSTISQFATKLVSTAHDTGILPGRKDPRPIVAPPVSEAALTYLLYLLREVEFEGTLLDNPYLRSVGLRDGVVDDRLRAARAFAFRRSANVVEAGWRHPDLVTWAGSLG